MAAVGAARSGSDEYAVSEARSERSCYATDKLLDVTRTFRLDPITEEYIRELIPEGHRSELADIIINKDKARLEEWIRQRTEGSAGEVQKECLSRNEVTHCIRRIPGFCERFRLPAFHLCVLIGFDEGLDLLLKFFLSRGRNLQLLMFDHRGNSIEHYAELTGNEFAKKLCKEMDFTYSMNDWAGLPCDVEEAVKYPKDERTTALVNTISAKNLLLMWWKVEEDVHPNEQLFLKDYVNNIFFERVYVPDVEVREDVMGGLGLFASRDIKAGDMLGFYSGPIFTLATLRDGIEDFVKNGLQRKNPFRLIDRDPSLTTIDYYSKDALKETGVDPSTGLSSIFVLANDGPPNMEWVHLPCYRGFPNVSLCRAIRDIPKEEEVLIFYGADHHVRLAHVSQNFKEVKRFIKAFIEFHMYVMTLDYSETDKERLFFLFCLDPKRNPAPTLKRLRTEEEKIAFLRHAKNILGITDDLTANDERIKLLPSLTSVAMNYIIYTYVIFLSSLDELPVEMMAQFLYIVKTFHLIYMRNSTQSGIFELMRYFLAIKQSILNNKIKRILFSSMCKKICKVDFSKADDKEMMYYSLFGQSMLMYYTWRDDSKIDLLVGRMIEKSFQHFDVHSREELEAMSYEEIVDYTHSTSRIGYRSSHSSKMISHSGRKCLA